MTKERAGNQEDGESRAAKLRKARSAALAACRAQSAERLSAALDLGASPDGRFGPSTDYGKGATMLCYASRQGWKSGVEALLSAGADPNLDGDSKEVPLSGCAQNDRVEIAKILLAAGAAADVKTHREVSLAMAFAGAGARGCLKMAMEAGCDILCADNLGTTALGHAMKRQHASCSKILIAAGAASGLTGLERRDVWVRSTQFLGKDMAVFLFENGLELSETDAAAATIWASIGDNLGMLEWLVEKGVEVEKVMDDGGMTALMCAARGGAHFAQTGSSRALAFLLERGSDPLAVNSEGQTAAACAREVGNVEEANWLDAWVQKRELEGMGLRGMVGSAKRL